MSSNPHAANADIHLHLADETTNAEGDNLHTARALVHAQLAVAYEQRTANLIAVATYIGQHGCKVHKDITAQIDERLGLK